jgi:hypothetical protein
MWFTVYDARSEVVVLAIEIGGVAVALLVPVPEPTGRTAKSALGGRAYRARRRVRLRRRRSDGPGGTDEFLAAAPS